MPFRRFLLAVLPCLVFPLALPAQSEAFKQALPTRTLAYFSLPDLDTSLQEFATTPLAKMWKENELQEFLAPLLEQIQARLDAGLEQAREAFKAGQLPLDPDKLMAVRLHNLTAALTRFEIKQDQFGQPVPEVGILLHANYGESAGFMSQAFEFMAQAALAESRGELTIEKFTTGDLEGFAGDSEGFSVVHKESMFGLHMLVAGGSIFIGTIQEEVKAAAVAMQMGKPVLSGTDSYQKLATKLEIQGAEFEWFVHLGPMVDTLLATVTFVTQNAPLPVTVDMEGVERVIESLGLRSLLAAGGTSSYVDGLSVIKGYVLLPAEARKGIFADSGKSLDLSLLRLVPEDVTNFTAMTVNPVGVYDGMVNAVKSYDPEAPSPLLAMLAAYEENMSVSLRDDMFNAIGDHMVWWSMGIKNLNLLQPPEGVLMMHVKDGGKLLKSLQTMAGLSQGALEVVKFERRGRTFYRLEINPERMEESVAVMLSTMQPVFALEEDYIVVALSTADVRKGLTCLKNEDDPEKNIRSNKRFKTRMQGVPAAGLTHLSWTDWRTQFENWYQAVSVFMPLVLSNDELQLDLALLPEADTLGKHLSSSLTWQVNETDGIRMHGVGPIGPEAVGVLGVVLAGFAATVVMPELVEVSNAKPAAAMVPVKTVPAKPVEDSDAEGEDEKEPSDGN